MGQAAGWRWDYWLGAVSTGVSFVFAIFLFPETLFSRDPAFLANRTRERTYMQMLWDFKGNMIPGRRLHATDFLQSFYMLKYPSVAFPFWYYTWGWTFINVMPAISLATIYTKFYHLKSGPIGACLGISLIIGSVLGEFFAGRASDYVMYRMAKRNNNIRKPEYRLYLSPLSAIFMPVGIIIFGACVGKTGYVPPLVGLGVGKFPSFAITPLLLLHPHAKTLTLQASSGFKSPPLASMPTSPTAISHRPPSPASSSISPGVSPSLWDTSPFHSRPESGTSGPGSRLPLCSSHSSSPLLP